ncbi:MAG: hypothetical protein ACI909_003797, partial [Planctomycetota bacterium]
SLYELQITPKVFETNLFHSNAYVELLPPYGHLWQIKA